MQKVEETTTTIALKEWAVTVDALGKGTQVLLLRKGGIREETRDFQMKSNRFFLYPAYEHQKKELLKPEYQEELTRVLTDWTPNQTEGRIQYFADLYEDIEIRDEETLNSLYSHHIWTNEFAFERLKWKKKAPLHLLLVRVYRLLTPFMVPIRDEYMGCKSWLELPKTQYGLSVQPILSEHHFLKEVGFIKAKLHIK